MSLNHSPSIVTNGLVLYTDMSNTKKSWKGAPTTNLNSGVTIGTYLNTPSDVTSVLTTTGETYKGSPIYKQVLTPITATGVGYLTNAGNPGIGVVTGGGGGLAARYTGHSIFFKPDAGRNGLNSSTPIYTHYSNIGGWQSSGNYDDMGDGWFRANVIYYNASGGGDGKYWAINPAGAVLNAPITIYWAGPFKEDRNDSTLVSPYVYDSRSTSQAIVDLTGNNTLTATSLTYASDNTFSFDGNSNYIQSNSSCGITSSVTLSAIIKPSYSGQTGWHSTIICTDVNYPYGAKLMNYKNTARYGLWLGFSGVDNYEAFVGTDINDNTTKMLTASWDQGTGIVNIYLNGVLQSSQSTGKIIPTVLSNGKITVGTDYNSIGSAAKNKFLGNIYCASVHNRALSADEVKQNFQALRGRYSL